MENKPIKTPAAQSEPGDRKSIRVTRTQVVSFSIGEREAISARQRIKTNKDGSIAIMRFPLLVIILHTLLLVAVSMLTLTGLAQILYRTSLGGFLLGLMGGLEQTQGIHHVFATLLALIAIIHLLDILESLFVRRQSPAMIPRRNDITVFLQTQKLNLGLSRQHPRSERYTYEEKTIYWLVSLGLLVLGVTGIAQWFPLQVTEFLPGRVIPYAGIIHRWEAILVMLVVFGWHLYLVLYRKVDASMFTGKKSREDMLAEHPLELEYIEKAAAAVGSPTWPVVIELNLSGDPIQEKMGQPPTAEDESALRAM